MDQVRVAGPSQRASQAAFIWLRPSHMQILLLACAIDDDDGNVVGVYVAVEQLDPPEFLGRRDCATHRPHMTLGARANLHLAQPEAKLPEFRPPALRYKWCATSLLALRLIWFGRPEVAPASPWPLKAARTAPKGGRLFN